MPSALITGVSRTRGIAGTVGHRLLVPERGGWITGRTVDCDGGWGLR